MCVYNVYTYKYISFVNYCLYPQCTKDRGVEDYLSNQINSYNLSLYVNDQSI